MSDSLHTQGVAARVVHRRQFVIAGIICALRDVQAQDHLLAQLSGGLTPDAWREISAALGKQDAWLADTLTDARTISPPPDHEA